jgi:hypothetical protein
MLAVALALGGTAGGDCFWVEGRLTVGNGTPQVRIWPKGTRRLLGVVTGAWSAEGEDLLPPNVESFLSTGRTDRVWGHFRVCPLEADRPGRMRSVRVVQARRLVSAGL